MANIKKTTQIFQAWMKLENNKAFAELIPAKTEKEAKDFCNGSGEVIAVVNVTGEYMGQIAEAVNTIENQEIKDILHRLLRKEFTEYEY